MATQAKKRKTHKSPQRAQETQEETSETNNGTITLSRKEKKRLTKANKLSKKGNGATNSVRVQRDWSDEEDDNEEYVNSPNNTPPEATNKTPNNEETEQPPDDDANSTPETVNTSTLTDNADTTHEPTNNNNNNNNNETALEPATLFSATLLEKILKPMFEQARQQQAKHSDPPVKIADFFCNGPAGLGNFPKIIGGKKKSSNTMVPRSITAFLVGFVLKTNPKTPHRRSSSLLA
eukprot:g29177.t1